MLDGAPIQSAGANPISVRLLISSKPGRKAASSHRRATLARIRVTRRGGDKPRCGRAYSRDMTPESIAPRSLAERGLTDPLRVQHMRQILLWPLRLIHPPGVAGKRPWQLLEALGDASPWREALDEYTGDVSRFHERHYHEFVTFLPYVQQFLYGEGRTRRSVCDPGAESPMRVFRRHDVAAVRVQARADTEPLKLDIVHIDLYFFYDVDVVLLNVEVKANDLTLAQAQELLYRFGRGYPAGWDAQGHALHTMAQAEWLGRDGSVLARSDSQDRDTILAFVHQ